MSMRDGSVSRLPHCGCAKRWCGRSGSPAADVRHPYVLWLCKSNRALLARAGADEGLAAHVASSGGRRLLQQAKQEAWWNAVLDSTSSSQVRSTMSEICYSCSSRGLSLLLISLEVLIQDIISERACGVGPPSGS